MDGVPTLMMEGSDRSDGDGHLVGANDGHHKLPRVLHGNFFCFFFPFFFPPRRCFFLCFGFYFAVGF